MNKSTVIFLLVLMGLLTGCNSVFHSATPTMTATNTPRPTATATMTPTNTTTPTLSPTPTNMPSKGYFDAGFYYVPLGGYGFQMPVENATWNNVTIETDFEVTTIRNDYETIWVQIGVIQHSEDFSIEDQISSIEYQITALKPDFEVLNNELSFMINEIDSRQLVFFHQGDRYDELIDWLVLDVGNNRFISIEFDVYGAPLSVESLSDYVAIRDQLLISFFVYDPAYASSSDCPVSGDPTYGYSEDNPILLGGGSYQSIDRKADYLHNLLGPNQESVTVNKLRSFMVDNLLLEEYELIYEGQEEPLIIYINTGIWSPISAPMGFTCKQPFSQVEP